MGLSGSTSGGTVSSSGSSNASRKFEEDALLDSSTKGGTVRNEDDDPDQPVGELIGRRTCPPGYSLANDMKCYRNADFKNNPKIRKIKGGES